MANSGIVGALKVLLGLDTAEFDAGIKGTKAKAKGLETDFSGIGMSLSKALLPAAGFAGVALGLANLARNAIQTAGRVSDLADQTGLSTQSIQEMDAAAKLTGTSLEAFTNAAFKLGVNLAGGTDKVRNAVEALGLSYATLRSQSPDQQFKTIASTLGEVEDKQLRNKLAVELFGRGAKEILPAIAQGYDQIADSAGKAGDEQIRALDAAGDAWTSFWNGAKALSTDVMGQIVINFRDSWEFMAITPRRALEEWAAAFEAFGLKAVVVPKVLGEARVAASLLPAPIKDVTMSLAEQNRVEKELTTSVEKKIAATVKGYDDMAAASERFKASVLFFNTADNLGTAFMGTVEQTGGALEELASNTDIATNSFEEFKKPVDESTTSVNRLSITLKEELLKTLQSIPQTLANAFTGGGGFEGAIKSLATQLGSGLGKLVASTMGFLGPWGQAIGGAVGSLASMLIPAFKKLFGIGKDEAEKFRESLLKQGLTFQELERRAKSVGMTLAGVWSGKGKKGAEALEAAIKKVNAALDAQRKKLEDLKSAFESELSEARSQLDGLFDDAERMGYIFDKEGKLVSVSFEKMQELAERFGVDINSLGIKFQGQKLRASAMDVVNAFELLAKGGADVGGILFGLKDEMSDLVNEARRTGQALPLAMKPWLEELLRAGLLTDENGRKLENLDGITFENVESEFTKVSNAILAAIQSINDLIARIDALIQQLLGLPNPDAPWADWPPPPGLPDYRNPPGPDDGIRFAAGGLVRRATRALIGEGGQPELVGPVSFMAQALRGAIQSLGAGSSGVGSIGLSPAFAGSLPSGSVTNYNTYNTYEIHTLDGDSFENVVRNKITPQQRRDLSNNTGGVRTGFRNDLGI